MSEISRICLNRLIIGIAVAAMTSGAAFAEDSSPPSQNGTLPGVTNDYRIAKPVPNPTRPCPATASSRSAIPMSGFPAA
ncbi:MULTISPECIES: hypothetical protein [unclassified Mesorhizobium]|uniref:hypothetical protein n=1 Tax=unclassified Mesorhizobium TaxID=325217 RepID=UPI0027BA20FA|nr:hypothetical protein [Mesorhizobium sp. L48C026A00]